MIITMYKFILESQSRNKLFETTIFLLFSILHVNEGIREEMSQHLTDVRQRTQVTQPDAIRI